MFEHITNIRLKAAVGEVNRLREYNSSSVSMSSLNEFTKNFVLADRTVYDSKDELLAVIEKSIKLLINYTLRPKWTLVNYIFGSLDSKPSADILGRASVFTFYHYYLELIRDVASDDESVSVRRIAVEAGIEQVNRDIYEKLVTDISSLKIKNLLMQVYRLKYGDNAEVTLDMSVPYSFIRLFFEDKGFTDIASKFEGKFRDDDEIDLKNVIKVLTGKYSAYKDFTAASVSDVFEEKTQEKEEPKHEDIKFTVPEKPALEEKTTVSPEKPDIKMMQEEKVLVETSREISAETLTDNGISRKGIKYLFKEQEIISISKKVFKGNKYFLLDAFLELEKLAGWREAADYLKKVFTENKVNHYDKSVILFVDVLHDYFDKRNG